MSTPTPYVKCPVCAGPARFDRAAERTVYCLDAPPTGGPCGFMGSLPDAIADPEPTDVKYPPGTPEYKTYAADLRAELDLFAAGKPPYDRA